MRGIGSCFAESTESLPDEAFTPVKLNLDKPKTVWVATVKVELSQLEGTRTIAIVMNASTFNLSSDIDYFITNVSSIIATTEWIVTTYSQRNWLEVFYREAKRMFEKGGAAVKQRPLVGTYRYSIYGCPPLLKHVLRVGWDLRNTKLEINAVY